MNEQDFIDKLLNYFLKKRLKIEKIVNFKVEEVTHVHFNFNSQSYRLAIGKDKQLNLSFPSNVLITYGRNNSIIEIAKIIGYE
jgi:hypothetical protein